MLELKGDISDNDIQEAIELLFAEGVATCKKPPNRTALGSLVNVVKSMKAEINIDFKSQKFIISYDEPESSSSVNPDDLPF